MARIFPLVAFGLAGAAVLAACSPGFASETAVRVPAPALVEPVQGNREVAVFAGGCFWGVQGVFSHVKGVITTTAGYAGGRATTAQYERVSTGTTGHAESVRVVFNPARVNYADLLRVYFSVVADPTQLSRQGPDEGTQYRTALFPQSPAQEKVARAYIAQLSAAHVYQQPIVTRIERNTGFFPAEEHHQNYMARNPDDPYIVYNDRPKVEALKRLFPASWRG
jgi:peptide-methionine (S)-S-oxide reductase